MLTSERRGPGFLAETSFKIVSLFPRLNFNAVVGLAGDPLIELRHPVKNMVLSSAIVISSDASSNFFWVLPLGKDTFAISPFFNVISQLLSLMPFSSVLYSKSFSKSISKS